jgi:hypothetical protein
MGQNSLGIHIKDSKLFIVSSMVILVIIVSAAGYGWIAKEEVRTGGMGEKWHMAIDSTYSLDMNMIRPDGSILFIDNENHLISLVDKDGGVKWSHNFGAYLAYINIMGDDLYLIDVTDAGQYALECISLEGIWKSSLACPPIQSMTMGTDGREFVSGYANDTSTIYCIEGGLISWSITKNGSLGISQTLDDGRLLLHHMYVRQDIINSSFETVVDTNEMIMLSQNGTVLWNALFPTDGDYYGSSSSLLADNGTIVLEREFNLQSGEWVKLSQGYSESGSLLWSSNESTIMSSSTDIVFGCWNRGDNVELVYKLDPLNDSESWNVLLNDTWGGSMYDLGGMEIFVSSNGHAYGLDTNGSILWNIDIGVIGTGRCCVDNDRGLLVKYENIIAKISTDGSYWVYDGIDATINDAMFGPNDTVYVSTADKLVVLYKPTVSTPTEYLIAMLSVDLLIALSSILWIADRLIKKPN